MLWRQESIQDDVHSLRGSFLLQWNASALPPRWAIFHIHILC